MKARRRPFSGTLDSLMDTTTNVVGILVIVLVITQLGVTGAVERIRASLPMVTAEQLDEQKNQLATIRESIDELTPQVEPLASQIAIDESVVVTSKATIDKLTAEMDAIHQANAAALKEREKVDEQTRQAQSLEAELAQALEEKAKLTKLLAQIPTQPAPAPKQVNLPNPRAAPTATAPLVVLCKHNRALVVPVQGLRNLAESRIGQLRLPVDAAGAVDGQQLVDFFDKVDIGNRQFRLRIRLHNFYAHLVFEPRSEAGDTIEAMSKPGSALRVDLHKADAKKQFARFLVWSDSFEAYPHARAVADEAGLSAGWEPMLPNQVYQINISDTVKVQRPPPPPAPKVVPTPPPAKPAGETPIAPPRPPLPKDDID